MFLFATEYAEQLNKIEANKILFGNKGYNLVEICSLGIPTPPGFILSTEICAAYSKNRIHFEFEIIQAIKDNIAQLEILTKKTFGGKYNPLLLSVRSGAVVSMPGMMDTILNIGLNDLIVEALAQQSNNFIFAYDSYRRLIQMYGSVVLGIEHNIFHNVLTKYAIDGEQSLDNLKQTIVEYKAIILQKSGIEFPQDIMHQLITSIEAVFKSWNSDRAIIYRNKNSIPHNLHTAVTIQTMVFGNMGETSCTGVLFTRNPISGEKSLFGEFLPKAQGEDVVAGYSDTYPLTLNDVERVGVKHCMSMEQSMPITFNELKNIAYKLEKYYGDMQDIEFTVEEEKLWILQTRNGKRSAAAAAKIAIDMVAEGITTPDKALKNIDPLLIEQNIHKQLAPNQVCNIIGRGLAAAPGVASGIIALTPQKAEILSKRESVILIRNETSPEDIAGMYAADGIITGKGGVTSHAAVVARGIGKPCICGVNNLRVLNDTQVSINGVLFNEEEHVTIDGSTGEIFAGQLKVVAGSISDDLYTIISWMKQYKGMPVMANAETLEDVKTAMLFGADGVGLCRTEHMFFSQKRIKDVRLMILAEEIEARKSFLEILSEYQRYDFLALLKVLDGKPLCIRLLDPPLHEFLPQTDVEIQDFCNITNSDFYKIKRIIQSLHEYNPMLGHRGCRLAITYPEIYASQASAIFHAMIDFYNEIGQDAKVEIMIPLIVSEKELIFIKNIIEAVKQDLEHKHPLKSINYKFGTMIELPRSALIADKLCDHVDFISFGTNDLTQTTLGLSRDDSNKFLDTYLQNGIMDVDPFVSIDEEGVGALMQMAINKIKAKKPSVKIGVCGEHAGDPKSILFFHKIGVDYISCSPYRLLLANLIACTI